MNNIDTLIGIGSSATGIFGCFREPEKKDAVKGPDPTERPAPVKPTGETNDFNGPSDDWEPANWENGSVFNCAWRPGNVSFSNGIMSLELKKEQAKRYPYTSGEYRSQKEQYGYGRYETRMKAASGNGLVTSFFVYSGTHGHLSHHEIDIEIFGKNPRQVQFNYFVGGKEGKKAVIDLPFDASLEFHDYGFEWTDKSIEWFVDGKSAYKMEGEAPYPACKIMMNLWPGTKDAAEWLGGVYDGDGTTAQYDWVRSPAAIEE